MANETLARRYGDAMFSVADAAGRTDRVGDDLARAADAIAADPAIADFFVSPIVERGEKERALRAAFGDRLDEIALHALLLLVRKRREALLPTVVAEYRKRQLAARGEEALTIASARELPPAELRALIERLQNIYGKTFQIKQVVDPGLIGGVRLFLGDRRIDGTIAGRIDRLSRTLFQTT